MDTSRPTSRLIVIAAMATALASGCSRPASREDKVQLAFDIMDRQVADDIDILRNASAVKLRDVDSSRYYVCGTAVLNRPGSGPLALHGASEDYIVTVNATARAGTVLFNGAKDAEGQAKFAQSWAQNCPH